MKKSDKNYFPEKNYVELLLNLGMRHAGEVLKFFYKVCLVVIPTFMGNGCEGRSGRSHKLQAAVEPLNIEKAFWRYTYKIGEQFLDIAFGKSILRC